MDGEQLAAFHGTPLRVRQRPTEAILSRAGGAKCLLAMALRIRIDLPAAFLRLLRDAFLIISDAIQLQHAFSADGSAVQRTGLHRRRHRVADQTVAAIQPDIRLERLAGDRHAALPVNFAAAGIRHGSRDLILVVAVAQQFLRHGGIHRNLHGSIGFQLLLQIHDDFWSLTAETAVIPTPTRRTAAPLRPARIPWAVRPEPPVAVSIIPVPRTDGPPFRLMRRTQDSDFGRPFRNRSAEIIFRLDGQFEFIAELGSLLRRFDSHFEFRLLVFLHAEHARTMLHVHMIRPKHRIRRQFERIRDAAVGIRRDLVFLDDVAARIADFHIVHQPRRGAFAFIVILRFRNPEFEFHLLAGPIDGTVRQEERTRLVLREAFHENPAVVEAVCRIPSPPPRIILHDKLYFAVLLLMPFKQFIRTLDDFSFVIRHFRKTRMVALLPFRLVVPPRRPAEELRFLVRQRSTAFRVENLPHDFPVHKMLFDDFRIREIERHAGGVRAVFHRARQKIPSCLLGWNRQWNRAVFMLFRRRHIHGPIGGRLLQIFLLAAVHVKQPPCEIREIPLIPVVAASFQIGEVLLAVRDDLVHVDALQREIRLRAVAEAEPQASHPPRDLLADVIDATPVACDLQDARLRHFQPMRLLLLASFLFFLDGFKQFVPPDQCLVKLMAVRVDLRKIHVSIRKVF